MDLWFAAIPAPLGSSFGRERSNAASSRAVGYFIHPLTGFLGLGGPVRPQIDEKP